MITITVKQDGQPAQKFTIPDEAQKSLEQYRESLLVSRPFEVETKDGAKVIQHRMVPQFDSVLDLAKRALFENVVNPALHRFPPPTVAEAQRQHAAATQALADAHAKSAGFLE